MRHIFIGLVLGLVSTAFAADRATKWRAPSLRVGRLFFFGTRLRKHVLVFAVSAI